MLHGSAHEASEASTSEDASYDNGFDYDVDDALFGDDNSDSLDKLFTMDAFDLKECKRECDAPWAEGRRRGCRAACGRRAREVYADSSARERAQLYARLESLTEEKEAWRAKERLMEAERAAMEHKLQQRAGDASREKTQWKRRSEEWREAFVAAKRQCSKSSEPPPNKQKKQKKSVDSGGSGVQARLPRLKSTPTTRFPQILIV